MNGRWILPLVAVVLLGTSGIAQQLHLEAKVQSPVQLVSAMPCHDGTQLLGMSKDGDFYAWGALASAPRRIAFADFRVTEYACSPDGRTIAVGGNNGIVALMSSSTGEITRRLKVGGHDIGGLSFSPDGSLLAVSANDSATQLWDLQAGKRLSIGKTTLGATAAVAFSPDGKIYLSADEDTIIRAYSRSGEPLYTAEADLLEPFAVAFTGDGKQFAVAGAGGTVSLFDASTGRKLKTSENRGNPIFRMMMAPDGRQVAALEFDDFQFSPKAMSLWNPERNEWKLLDVDLKTIIGAGSDKTHLLFVRKESPEALSLWSLQ